MRLIDADELIKQFHYGGIADTEEDKAWIATIRRTIKAQPTAYDIDKVVEYLEEKSVAYCREYCYAEDENVLYLPDAIEIVKKGGGTDE